MKRPTWIIRIVIPVAAFATLSQRVAEAGMPSITITELASFRLEAISFFLVCYLACSWVIRAIWNGLRSDFPRLPQLSMKRAMGVVGLWGLLFLLILTMISGARELMTPGAWEKEGYTYKLAPKHADKATRHEALDRLRVLLWHYAKSHDGKFPPNALVPEIPDDSWRIPDPSDMHYRYEGGLSEDVAARPLAFEPNIFGNGQLVLLTDGRIVSMDPAELTRSLKREDSR